MKAVTVMPAVYVPVGWLRVAPTSALKPMVVVTPFDTVAAEAEAKVILLVDKDLKHAV